MLESSTSGSVGDLGRYLPRSTRPWPPMTSLALNLESLEEIVAFVVYENVGREVLDFNPIDGFHAELGVFQ